MDKWNILNKSDINQVKPLAQSVCKEYLGGIWKTVTDQNFKIEKIIGGLSCHIYKCFIDDEYESKKRLADEPKEILLRLYGRADNKNLINELIVISLLSEYKIAPKLYGVFPIGRLEEFLHAKPLNYEDYFNLGKNRKLAREIARIHALDMPINKEPQLFEQSEGYIKRFDDLKFYNNHDQSRFNKLMLDDLTKEYYDLKKFIETNLHSAPVVLCHNDISVSNILQFPDEKLMLIDYEYCCYNYRGFDFAVYFGCKLGNIQYVKHPFFEWHLENVPTHEQFVDFFEAYIQGFKEACKETSSKNSIICSLNVENLIYETNVFFLAALLFYIFDSLFFASTNDNSVNFDYIAFCEAKAEAYFHLKSIHFPNGF